MRMRVLIPLFLLVSGCVSTKYTLVPAGSATVGNLQLSPVSEWNAAPEIDTPLARKSSQSWTVDGLNLNRLMVIADVADGESIFVPSHKGMALPLFKSDMLPNELVELTESSFEKLYEEGKSDVRASNLRPYRFGDRPGVMFDLDLTLADGPGYRGLVGAFTANSRLYLVAYIAAVPYYFEKDLDSARRVIESAHVT